MNKKRFVKDRNKAFIKAVMYDDWASFLKFCEEYNLLIPANVNILKAGVYKAVQQCSDISEDVKTTASIKCIDLGFNPFINFEGE